MYKLKIALEKVLAIVLVVPTMMLILLLVIFILFVSPGNPFFVQKRVGKNGKVFSIVKLRTMYLNVSQIERENVIKSGEKRKYDPRLYPGGRLIRRWSLDELPQLYNILRGEMSFVGPRPAQIHEINRWSEDGYKHLVEIRLKVLPGISGLAQINGRDDLTTGQKLSFDALYVNRYDWLMELHIWTMTPIVVILGKGAY